VEDVAEVVDPDSDATGDVGRRRVTVEEIADIAMPDGFI
jgi:hypothetical protein